MSAPPERHLSIYDGRDHIGMVVDRGNVCDAFDVSGVHLGTFKKLKAASDAVNSSRLVSCVPDNNGRMDGGG